VGVQGDTRRFRIWIPSKVCARIGAARPRVRREPFCSSDPTFRWSPLSTRAGGYVVRLVYRGLTDRSAFLPSPRDRARGEPRILRRPDALARCGTVSRRSLHPRGPSTGGVPRSLPRRMASPLPSSTFRASDQQWSQSIPVILEVPIDRGARHTRACVRDPPDLDADSPVASLSMRSDLPAGLPLLGFPKIAPPSY